MKELSLIKDRMKMFAPQIDDSRIEDIVAHLKLETFKRNEYLQKAGQIPNKAYLITEGIARNFFKEKDKERTLWFFYEGDPIRGQSYMMQHPATNDIICVTDVKAWTLTWDASRELVKQSDFWEKVAGLSRERFYADAFNVWKEMKYKPATQRYKWYISRYPQAAQYIPIGQLASFLGIAIETLSRIRSKK
ncbi:MAG: Crp/Fnr family transcriptional regulator [Verrucomicrobia bacterium]|nr:Crp/Fnr family transcriptional regulator [Cytophagales bacterium]